MSSNQPNYAETTDNFANDTPLQLTLRVMQSIYSNPRFWVGMSAVILILTIMGPFNTLVDMTVAPRMVYWAGISLFTFPVAMVVSIFCGIWFEQRGVPQALARLIGGATGGIPVGGIVFVANAWFANTIDGSLLDLARMTAYTIPISAAISVIYYLVETSIRGHSGELTSTAPAKALGQSRPVARFFKRLPIELGRDLISLQAQDHYVRVVTTRGTEMVLIRLADAEHELENHAGFRVHRSWWVADAHLDRMERRDGKALLILDNGTEIPVSRSYLAEVRAHLERRDRHREP